MSKLQMSGSGCSAGSIEGVREQGAVTKDLVGGEIVLFFCQYMLLRSMLTSTCDCRQRATPP
jgi:hypothetical protein